MTVEHLMTYTSGLFYPFTPVLEWNQDIDNAYSAPQDKADPAGGFIKVIKVRDASPLIKVLF
jgi:CubicO group peptidase (beta-lactamase class C family)